MGPRVNNGGFLEYVERYHGSYLATAPTNLVGAPAIIGHYHMPFEVQLTGWYVVVTTLLAMETIQPVVSINVADYDTTTNTVEADEYTIPDLSPVGFCVADTLAAPVTVLRGRTIVLHHKTSGTGGAAAGAACVFAIWRATGN